MVRKSRVQEDREKWEDKIEESISRKSLKLKEITKNMKKQTKRVDSKNSFRKKTENLSELRMSSKSLKAYSNAFNNKTIHNPEN